LTGLANSKGAEDVKKDKEIGNNTEFICQDLTVEDL
jgi:hypothetical protein